MGLAQLNAIALGDDLKGKRVRIAEVDHPLVSGRLRAIDVAAPVASGALGVVHVGMDRDAIEAEARDLRSRMALGGLGIAAVGLGLILLVVFLMVVRPVREMTAVAASIARTGDLEQHMEVRSSDEIGQLAQSFRALVDAQRQMSEVAASVSRGTIDVRIEPRSERDVLAVSVQGMVQSLRALTSDANELSAAAVAGQLSTRADVGRHRGVFAEILGGVNATLDALTGPMAVAADYVARISRGDIPEKIDAEYRGEFDAVKQNLNQCIEAVGRLVSDAQALSEAAVAGRLDTRVDPSRHQGDFARIIGGVNATLDAFAGPVQQAARFLEQISHGEVPERVDGDFPGDFGALRESLERCAEAIRRLVADAQMLGEAAAEGRLSARADSRAHRGDFARIIDGVNQALDGIVTPVRDISAVLQKLAGGDLTARVEAEYRGDYDQLKSATHVLASQITLAIRKIAESANGLALAAEGFARMARDLNQNAQGTSSRAATVSDSARQVGLSVETVAGATNDMTGSIAEISKSTSRASGVAASAVHVAKETDQTIRDLARSSAEITTVIKTIRSIADQTNLLAINAAIEATRAGNSGKGFAVVANEVKKLARETGDATREIERKIDGIQGTSRAAASAVKQIGGVIQEIHELQSSIAAAVAQQTATTNGISRSVTEAARRSASIAEVLGQVSEAARSTHEKTTRSQAEIADLARMASELRELVGRFRLEA